MWEEILEIKNADKIDLPLGVKIRNERLANTYIAKKYFKMTIFQ